MPLVGCLNLCLCAPIVEDLPLSEGAQIGHVSLMSMRRENYLVCHSLYLSLIELGLNVIPQLDQELQWGKFSDGQQVGIGLLHKVACNLAHVGHALCTSSDQYC